MIITATAFFLIFSNAYSNNKGGFLIIKNASSEITDTTYECTVVSVSKTIFAGANLCGLSDSSVTVLRGGSSTEILIKDIRSVKFKGRGFWKGAAIGSGIGFVLGFLAGASLSVSLSEGNTPPVIGPGTAIGALFAVPFGLIGGGLGVLFTEDKFYNLSKLDFDEKRKKVRYLIIKYSDR